MDVLELPRPVINFLRTISKEMNRYSLCWDIYGGSESVTLTLTWKINCDESDDEQLAKSRRQHQQQLNKLINMDLNSNIFTDNNSNTNNSSIGNSSINATNSNSNLKTSSKTPSTPNNKTKQLQHSKLDKLVSQSSTSSNNCLFSSKKQQQQIDPTQSSDSYDPYIDTKSKRSNLIQQNKSLSRNYSAETNAFITNYDEDLKDLTSNSFLTNKQHKSRRPKSTNHSLERGSSSHQLAKENDKNYLDFNRTQSINISDNDNDDDDLYDTKTPTRNVYPKKILKYTRGKSLENFDHSTNDSQYENYEHHRYCQNCTHNNQMPFVNNNRLYQQPPPPQLQQLQHQPQYITRSEQNYYNPQQIYQPPPPPPPQYMINQSQLPIHQQQQYSNYNSNLIKISSNTSSGNNEKVCLNNQRLLLENYNPYSTPQQFSYPQQQQQQPQPQQSHYMQSTKPQLNYIQDLDQNDSHKQQNYFKATKQKSLPPSGDPNRTVYSQTAISKQATSACNHNANNSSNTENNSDSSSSENLVNSTNPSLHTPTSTTRKTPPNPAEPICINSSSNFNATSSNTPTSNINSKQQQTTSSNVVSNITSSNNPWIRRNVLTETKENIVSESTFSKLSTTNEVTDTSYEYTNPITSNNTNNDFHSANVSLPIISSTKSLQQTIIKNECTPINSNINNASNLNNSSNTNSMHRVTFDPKLDK